MGFQVRGLSGISQIFKGGSRSNMGAIVPSGAGNLGQIFTTEARHLARHQPRFGRLTPENVVQMASAAEAAKRQQVLFTESAKHYQQMAQVAVQAHATAGQIAQATARADEGFQRTNKALAQAGFKHGLMGNTQAVQQSVWEGRRVNAKAALYG